MEICAICLEDTDHNCYKTLCCKHKFHFECLDTWFKIKNTCPLCRREYSHMQDYTCDMENYLNTIENIDMKNVVNNFSNIVTTYKYQFEEFNSPFLVNLLDKTGTFLSVVQDFYDKKD